MEENDETTKSTPGLPEALNPEIGNGALWEEDPHFFNLRSPDPSKSIENFLFDPDEKAELKKILTSNLSPVDIKGLSSEEGFSIPDKDTPKSKRKSKVLRVTSRSDETLSDWPGHDELVLKEDPNKPQEVQVTPAAEEHKAEHEIPVEGKRVKKALKKAQKELKKLEKKAEKVPKTVDSGLSPFTSWLKGLRGSEYVHPYEDDYGLEQQVAGEGISETLADLLARQGFKERAIEMYRALMAKYPEKSSFFAAKIEALI